VRLLYPDTGDVNPESVATSKRYDAAPVVADHEAVNPLAVTLDAVGVAGAELTVMKLPSLPYPVPAEFVALALK